MTSSRITDELLSRVQQDLQNGLPLDRMQFADDRIVGLRSVVYRNGPTKFLLRGAELSVSSITEARQLALSA